MKYIVNTHEIGLLYENDSFITALSPKTYRFSPWSKKTIRKIDITKDFVPKFDLSLYLKDEILSECLDVVNIKDNEIGIHYSDGNFCSVLNPGKYAYFNILKANTFTILDRNNPFIPEDIDKNILDNIFSLQLEGDIYKYEVLSGEVGILIINGEYIKTLKTGTYYFMQGQNSVEIKRVETRKTIVEVCGQELLSKDKVTLRMNFTCQYKIIDYIKVATEFARFSDHIYLNLQLALREYVSTRTLDELLDEKHEIGKIILEIMKAKEQEYGVEFLKMGVKDIILPGEIRDILNTVLIAEKKAKANVITRREETAATRSLLNTAKLIDENKTLYKLKELEYLEHICDKVGDISISANAGIITQLRELVAER